MILFIIGLALSPSIFFTFYYYKKDKYDPEPLKKILQVYFLGWILAFFVGFANTYYLTHYGYFSGITIFAPIFEESIKFLGVYYFIFKNKNFNEPMDGIIYSATLALGFASLENIHYLFRNQSQILYVAVLRAFLSVPAHAIFSICWGYGLSKYKFTEDYSKTKLFLSLGLGILLHGIFNLIPTLGLSALPSILLLISYFSSIMIRIRNRYIKEVSLWSKEFLKK